MLCYPPHEINLNIKEIESSSPLGEERGEGLPVGKLSKELHLTPNPSVLDFLHAQFCRCFLRSASRNFKLRYPELHSVRKSAPIGEGNKSAFTLAEVLITLVIIGVIAAITVPTLINKTNKQEYGSKLKKAYSTLSQVTNQMFHSLLIATII